MQETKYAYIRVSSRDQNEARQMDALAEFELNPKNIIVEKQSGGDFDRPKYKKLIRKLKAHDLLILHSLDRLGRNYDEILEQWRNITKEKQADILILDFPLLDTRRKFGDNDLTGRFIANLVLEVLAYVAHKERENIRQRQAEGIASAKARGVRFGRETLFPPDDFPVLKEQYLQKQLTSHEAAKSLDVSDSTFLRWVKGQRGAAIPE